MRICIMQTCKAVDIYMFFFSADSGALSSISCSAAQSSTTCCSRQPTTEKTLHRGGTRREGQRPTWIPGDQLLFQLCLYKTLSFSTPFPFFSFLQFTQPSSHVCFVYFLCFVFTLLQLGSCQSNHN